MMMVPLTANADPTVPESPCCTADLMDDQAVVDITTDSTLSCNSACQPVGLGGGLWGMDCTPTANADSEDTLVGAKMVGVFDPPGGETFCHEEGNLSEPREYCVFGVDALGEEFYCSWDHDRSITNLARVSVSGASEGDVIQFWWNSSTVEYNMDGWTNATFEGVQLGYQGADQLIGSRSTNAYYTDRIYGGTGEDRECGLAGNDVMNGEGDADQICGDADLDTLTGGSHNDILCGLHGNGDELDGGVGNDWLSHGDDGEAEYNDGGPDSGTGTQDTCDDEFVDVNCENTWTSDPCDSL